MTDLEQAMRNADWYSSQLVAALRRENDALADALEARAELADLREVARGLVDACDNLRPASDFVERLRVLTTGGDRG